MKPQKRLLILGGQQKLCDVVNKAREMGIYTVVTDWYENSPAKEIADKSYMVSTSDVDAILSLIRDEKIDGVITGYIDSTLPYYYEICKRAGLPCYLNPEILECGTNKRRFKEVCAEVGLKTIPEVSLENNSSIDYPVLIKPVDNSGSKGITVCCNQTMVDNAVERAKRFSKRKEFIVERFMNCDYIATYYTVQNGNVQLSLLMDKDMNRIGRGTVPYPVAFVYPSRYYEQYYNNVHPLVVKLANHLGIKNGTFQISFFVSGDNYYAVELTVRLTATREYLLIKDMTGTDTLEMYINYALNGTFACSDYSLLDDQNKIASNNSVYCMLLFFLKDGVIKRIEGMDKILSMRGLLNVLQLRDVGAGIRVDGSYGQLFAKIYLKADSPKELVGMVDRIEDELRVYSEDGRPMIIAGFDARRFFV